jgi:hypothetical protein
MRSALFAPALSLAIAAAVHAADVAVDTCGTIVPAGARGTLQADLDCSAASPGEPAVVLANRATLTLGGFTLTGAANGTAVHCPRHCAVRGPGTVTSAPAGPGELRAACIRAVPEEGAASKSQKVKVENLSLTGCGAGVVGGTGPLGTKLTIKSVIADGNDASFTAGGIRARDVRAMNGGGAGFLVPTGSMTGVNVQADGNDPTGVEAARLRLKDSSASGNVAFGVVALTGAAKLLHTTATGNGIRDVVSARPPHVSDSTCETSAEWIAPNGIGGPWGVCSGD